jgi:hypothetical protein
MPDDAPANDDAPTRRPRRGNPARHPDTRTAAIPTRIPLLPKSLQDETFGSWLRRCAVSHRQRDVAAFAASILSLEGLPPAKSSTDWDCDPPLGLVQILNERGRIPLDQMHQLIVPQTDDTLVLADRDAYCPECFRIDMADRAIHRRRQWLDAWTMTCSVHGCLLWSYEHSAAARAPGQQWRTILHSEQIRLGMAKLGYVTGFSPPDACWYPLVDMPRRVRDERLSSGRWLDRAMLTSGVGRSLVLLCGSIEGDSVYYVLFGRKRPKSYGWSGQGADGAFGRSVTSPSGRIRERLTAAYTAAAIWRLLGKSRREGDQLFTSVDQIMKLCSVGKWTDRWPVL